MFSQSTLGLLHLLEGLADDLLFAILRVAHVYVQLRVFTPSAVMDGTVDGINLTPSIHRHLRILPISDFSNATFPGLQCTSLKVCKIMQALNELRSGTVCAASDCTTS
jgi:hypothetical protein